MLAIKLSRVGKKKQPAYRVIVTEKSRDPWGKHNEIVGFYNPMSNPKEIKFKEDRIKYWLSKGAQPSDTVHNLLVNAKLIDAPKVKAHPTHKLSEEEMAEIEEKKKAEAEKAKAKAEKAEAAKKEKTAKTEETTETKEEAPAAEEKSKEGSKTESSEPAEETKEESGAEAVKEEAPVAESKTEETPTNEEDKPEEKPTE